MRPVAHSCHCRVGVFRGPGRAWVKGGRGVTHLQLAPDAHMMGTGMQTQTTRTQDTYFLVLSHCKELAHVVAAGSAPLFALSSCKFLVSWANNTKQWTITNINKWI